MPIRRWHWGKIAMLWAWGAVISGLMLSDFLGTPVQSSPLLHLVELISTASILLALSVMTWRWLSGKESAAPEEKSEAAGKKDQD